MFKKKIHDPGLCGYVSFFGPDACGPNHVNWIKLTTLMIGHGKFLEWREGIQNVNGRKVVGV